MADDTQQSGSMIGDIASGLGKVAQYALPAALGAAMGGVGGAAAGLGMGAEGIQEQQERQVEIQTKQQELALRWQQFGLESQQAQMALATAKSWQDYTSTLPDDERPLAMENPQEYTKNKIEMGQWKLGLDSLKGDPTFAKTHNVDPKAVSTIEALGPTIGKPLLEKYMESLTSGKYPNGVHATTNADGTTSLIGVGPNGETTIIASGVSPKVISTPEAKDKQQLDIQKQADKMAEDDTKARWWLSSDKRDAFKKQRREMYMKQLGGEAVEGVPSPTPSAPSGPVSNKGLWGKKGVIGPDGRKWNIDTMGKATPA